ncbi:hypothetical protein ASU35_10945 [Acetivibrio ethanolgignens]|uniref:HTH cro/C1-type domain-containing protein n=2 Tax=Acetivibrio ethanolgignens TaxID=290052 RepID=A0A0V8QFC2_9FIRM|nr:hypothetical protein ASU35_10945 [Acetivibrio ethanolgignens]
MPEQYIILIDHMIELRKTKGWTQKDLSAACGLTQSVIARIESKKSVPTIITLQRIVSALDATLILKKQED